MIRSLQETLEQLGVAMMPPEARDALGRLAGLELGSQLGFREARRTLARERAALITACVRAIERIEVLR